MPYKNKEKAREYALSHKVEKAAWHRQYYQLHKVEMLERSKRYHQLHKTIRTARYWEYRVLLKREVLIHYGNSKCACVKCGFTDVRALSIDHIDGNGVQHRQALGICGGRQFYVWLKKNNFPKGYQTLCMNCQYIKRSQEKEYGGRIR